MRCPPRAPSSAVMDAVIAVPVGAMPCNRGCVAEKSPLTNRIRRQFARIKAVRTDRYRSWLLSEFWRRRTSHDSSAAEVRTFRRRKSGHFEDESQDISKTKVRTFRRRKSGHFEDESQDTSG